MYRYSPSTGGFYPIDAEAPADSVPVTARRYAALFAAQAEGAQIQPGKSGSPVAHWPSSSIEARRAAAIAAVKAEASRRILAIAPAWRQANDAAAMAQAALEMQLGAEAFTVDFPSALGRRRAIDAVRAQSDELEAAIATFTAAQLDEFAAAADAHWS